jgi:hypothetical protein
MTVQGKRMEEYDGRSVKGDVHAVPSEMTRHEPTSLLIDLRFEKVLGFSMIKLFIVTPSLHYSVTSIMDGR